MDAELSGRDVERLRVVFSESLGIEGSRVVDSLAYNDVPEWDSIAHMALIAAIEGAFDIAIDADDVIDMSTFAKAQVLVARYGA